MNKDDHDILIRVDTNLVNLIDKVETHIDSDDVKFAEHDKILSFHSRIVYGGVGAMFIINLLIVLFK